MGHKKALLKLNLGCGFDKRLGYVNLDVDPRVKPDKVHDLHDPLPYPADSVNEILLQDVLEHFTKEDGEQLLKECLRVLTSGGKILIRVPNPQAIVSKFQSQLDLMMLYLYGDTSQNGVWGAHKYGYTPALVREIGDRLGFRVVSVEAIDTNWEFGIVKASPGEYNEEESKIIGYVPEWFVSELKKLGGEWMVLGTVWSQLFLTLPMRYRNKKVAWFVTEVLPAPIAKTIMRKLVKLTHRIGIEDRQLHQYLTQSLQFSHLRIIDRSINKKTSRN